MFKNEDTPDNKDNHKDDFGKKEDLNNKDHPENKDNHMQLLFMLLDMIFCEQFPCLVFISCIFRQRACLHT